MLTIKLCTWPEGIVEVEMRGICISINRFSNKIDGKYKYFYGLA